MNVVRELEPQRSGPEAEASRDRPRFLRRIRALRRRFALVGESEATAGRAAACHDGPIRTATDPRDIYLA